MNKVAAKLLLGAAVLILSIGGSEAKEVRARPTDPVYVALDLIRSTAASLLNVPPSKLPRPVLKYDSEGGDNAYAGNVGAFHKTITITGKGEISVSIRRITPRTVLDDSSLEGLLTLAHEYGHVLYYAFNVHLDSHTEEIQATTIASKIALGMGFSKVSIMKEYKKRQSEWGVNVNGSPLGSHPHPKAEWEANIRNLEQMEE